MLDKIEVLLRVTHLYDKNPKKRVDQHGNEETITIGLLRYLFLVDL